MKNKRLHIAFFAGIGTILLIAATLTLQGWVKENGDNIQLASADLSLDEKPTDHVLDTLQYFEDCRYDYCQLEPDMKCPEKVDILSKTVVRVENNSGRFENFERSSIKNFSPNRSLNLMIETYTVKRKVVDSLSSFFVTVESFNTQMECVDFSTIDFGPEPEPETSLTSEQINNIKNKHANELLMRAIQERSRPY